MLEIKIVKQNEDKIILTRGDLVKIKGGTVGIVKSTQQTQPGLIEVTVLNSGEYKVYRRSELEYIEGEVILTQTRI